MGARFFRDRLKRAFLANQHVTNQNEIEKLLARGEFVVKEIDALYALRKYRFLRRSYYDTEVRDEADRQYLNRYEQENSDTGSTDSKDLKSKQ